MNNNYRVLVFVLFIILFSTSCSTSPRSSNLAPTSNQPQSSNSINRNPFPEYGAYFVQGNKFVEITKYLGEPDSQSIMAKLLIANRKPTITFWYPEINFDYLALMRIDRKKDINYSLSPKANVQDTYEITPKDELEGGIYCLLLGGPTASPMRVPFWCFRVEDGSSSGAVSNLPSTSAPTSTPAFQPTVYPFRHDTPRFYNTVSMAWSPNSNYLAIAQIQAKIPFVAVIDMKTGKQIITRQIDPKGWLSDLAWTPDSSNLAYSTGLSGIVLINVKKDEIVWEANVGNNGTRDLEWMPNGEQLVDGAYKFITFIDGRSGEIVNTFKDLRTVHWISISPDGKYLMASSSDKGVWVWDLTTNKQIYYSDEAHPGDIEWSPDSKLIAIQRYLGDNNYAVDILDNIGFEPVLTIKNTAEGLIHWSPDGKYISIGRSFNIAGTSAGIYNSSTGELVRSFQDFPFSDELLWSPDGKYIAAKRSDGLYILPVENYIN